MFRHTQIRSALLSGLVALLLLLMIAGFPGPSVGQATAVSLPAAPGPAAQPCQFVPTFLASNFPPTTDLPNTGVASMYPLVPGTQFTLEGVVNDGSGQPVGHRVILVITDLTKIVGGVRTWVLWDRDFTLNLNTQTYQLTEAELAFHVIDNQGNPWNLGEYPAQYDVNGNFTDAPDTWISGLKSNSADPAAQGGWVLPGGTPQVGTQTFLQAYAKNIIGDCGIVSAVGVQHVCNSSTGTCYDNVTVVDETSPPELGTQQKYYAAGVGNFRIGAINNDPQGETLEMTQRFQLSQGDCIAARNAALALDDQARNNDSSQTVYKQSQPMVSTGKCAEAPTATPTATASPTATPTVPAGTPRSSYLPLASKPLPTPTLPPQLYDGCTSDPNPAAASNFPVKIVGVNKLTEVVTLQNVSNVAVSLEDWNLCSINGNQDHDQIGGTIAAGQTRSFPNIGSPNIWNDSQRDDAALYNSFGIMVSYWIDQ